MRNKLKIQGDLNNTFMAKLMLYCAMGLICCMHPLVFLDTLSAYRAKRIIENETF